MKRPYCCDETTKRQYETYYANQQNGYGYFPVFVGAVRQRGHGIGNVVGFFKRLVPAIKAFAPHALRAGADIFEDVNQGQSLTDSAMQRVPAAISRTVFGKNTQSGSGLRRRRAIKKKKRDIFS